MKILLIIPPLENWALKGYQFAKNINLEAGTYFPLGLVYVATYLKKNSNHQVKVIDAPTEKLSSRDLIEKVINQSPEIVGISTCTEVFHDVLKLAERIKDINKDIKIILGGPQVSIYPQETVSKKDVDYCVIGDGEIAFFELVNAIHENRTPDNIPGVISKNKINKNHEIQKIEDLDSIPFPDRTLLNIKQYKSFITYSNPSTTMVSSRGCRFNCYFCNSIERNQQVRFRSPENVVGEMEHIKKLGIKDIMFFDENFTLDINRVEKICDLLIEKKLYLRWHCRSRVDMQINERIVRKMKKAGCRLIQFGIETGTQRLQKVINKNLDLARVKQVIKMVKDQGIYVYGNFMLGLPTETREEMVKTIQFAIDLDLDYAPFNIFYPLPDSVFYDRGLKDGIIKKDYWKEYVQNPEKKIEDYFWPEQNVDLLSEMLPYAYRKFYFRPRYMVKALFRKQSIKLKLWQLKSAVKIFFSKSARQDIE